MCNVDISHEKKEWAMPRFFFCCWIPLSFKDAAPLPVQSLDTEKLVAGEAASPLWRFLGTLSASFARKFLFNQLSIINTRFLRPGRHTHVRVIWSLLLRCSVELRPSKEAETSINRRANRSEVEMKGPRLMRMCEWSCAR